MRRVRSLVAGLCAVAVVAGTFGAGVPGARAQQNSVPQLKFEKYTLANGLQVILHEDHKLPAVNVNLWYHVGSKNEQPGRTGFAHLFEHMMFQGSKNTGDEYLQIVEKAGANLRTGGVNGTTNNDRTNYFETVPSESLEYAIWLESDRMGYLLDKLTPEKLENQRDVVKNEKRQGENQPYGRAFSVVFEELFPEGHPYSWSVIGSMDDLSAASVDDVKNFFKKYYTPNNATLAIVGDFQPAKAKALIEKYFGPLAPGPALERPALWYASLPNEKRIDVSDRVPQARIYLAYPSVAYFQPDDAELDIASSVLAGGKTSRLYKSLVYDKQIASDVNAFNFGLEIAGLFGITATAKEGKSLDEIDAVIRDEIARLAKDGPTADEVDAAKTRIETGFVSGLERIGGFGGKADVLNQYNTYLGSPDMVAKDVARYRNATPASVKAAVNRYLNTRNRLVVSYASETSGRPSAQEFDRKEPAFGERAAFAPTLPKSRTLPNGMTVIVQERHEIPTVAVNLVVRSGAASDPAAKPGVANMTAAMLDEGAGSRSALQISDDLDKLGTGIQTFAASEASFATMSMLSRNVKPALGILADVVTRPTFPGEELERQRSQRLDAIEQERQNPAATAALLFPQLVYGSGHPYGHPAGGTIDSVKAITVADLKGFHEANYKAGNATIVFVGDVTLDQAAQMTEEAFGSWQKGSVAKVTVPTAKPMAENVVYLVDRQDAPQSQIRIGAFAPPRSTEDYYAIEVLNSIFGGAFSSRLNLNLREAKGYTYGAFNNISYRTTPGFWASSAGVRTDVTKESLVEFENEIKGISGAKPITAAEMDAAKANLARGYAQRFESNDQIAGEIGTLVAFGLPVDTLAKYESGVTSISDAQALAAAKKFIDPAKTVILVVGDLSKIEEGVRSLNLGRVVVVDADGKPIANR